MGWFQPKKYVLLRSVLLYLTLLCGYGDSRFNSAVNDSLNNQDNLEESCTPSVLEHQLIDLQSQDYKTRVNSAFLLCRCGHKPEAAEMVPQLIKLMGNSSDVGARITTSKILKFFLLSKQCSFSDIAAPEFKGIKVTYSLPRRLEKTYPVFPCYDYSEDPPQELQESVSRNIEKSSHSQGEQQKAIGELADIFRCAHKELSLSTKGEILNLLIDRTRNENVETRRFFADKLAHSSFSLIQFLESSPPPKRERIFSALIEQLQNDRDKEVRSKLIKLFEEFLTSERNDLNDAEEEKIINALINQLSKEDSIENQSDILNLLGKVNLSTKNSAKNVVSGVVDFYIKWKIWKTEKSQDENYYLGSICDTSRNTLSKIGVEAQAAISTLARASKEQESSNIDSVSEKYIDCHLYTPSTIATISEVLQDKRGDLGHKDIDAVVSELTQFLKLFEDSKYPDFIPGTDSKESVKERIGRAISSLQQERKSRYVYNYVIKPFTEHRWLYGLVAVPTLYLIIWGLRPRWLLFLPVEINIPKLGKVPIPVILFLKYRPRVLDAWVEAHLEVAREGFAKRTTVNERKVHIAIPIILDSTTLPTITPQILQPIFNENRITFLICGEGGSGKTSLACQLAQWAMAANKSERLCNHAMLPALLEQELTFKESKQPFKDAIKGQLQALISESTTIPDELLDRLLRHRRILVIVDHFSEMNEATRQEIRPGHPDFSANSIVITSRLKESLDDVPKTVIEPLRFEGVGLPIFMQNYLMQRKKRELFSDQEFLDACSQLSRIAGQHKITVLMAKLYAEQMIAQKENETPDDLPANIPDLMLSYINELNRGSLEKAFSDRVVQKDVKAIAWECLKQSYQPSPVNRDVIVEALEGEGTESRLSHLEEKLRIIKTIGAAQDQIRFALDPLAEYLAALHLIDTYRNDSSLWQDFLNKANSLSGSPITGFLVAVQDCCVVQGLAVNLPSFVLDELSKKLDIAVH